jgi:mannose-1-phosphate guanylyltransferase/mannose-6-phosphate isomerase
MRETYERARAVADEVFVLTETRQRDIIEAVLPEIDAEHLILEPSARGTTNAYGLATLTLAARDPDAVLVAMPADHVVRGGTKARDTLLRAVRAAVTSNSLVTVGLKPAFPSTGLGYIHAPGRTSDGAVKVKQFIEKPDIARARRFVNAGGYYWNLAWFVWRLPVFIEELGRYAPSRLAALRRVLAAREAGDEAKAARLYNRLPVDVIDRTVMEKTNRLLLVPGAFDWAGIGNWAELGDRVHHDALGNAVEGETVLVDTHGSLVFGDRRLVAAIGLDDMIIVDTPDALLVCPRSRAQDVKRIVDALKRSRKTRYL